jgi:hypothetical protein
MNTDPQPWLPCLRKKFTCLHIPECAGHIPRGGHNLIVVQKPTAGQVTENKKTKIKLTQKIK